MIKPGKKYFSREVCISYCDSHLSWELLQMPHATAMLTHMFRLCSSLADYRSALFRIPSKALDLDLQTSAIFVKAQMTGSTKAFTILLACKRVLLHILLSDLLLHPTPEKIKYILWVSGHWFYQKSSHLINQLKTR